MKTRVRSRRLQYKLARKLRQLLGIRKTVYVQERVGQYRELWREGAASMGFAFRDLGGSFWEVRDGERLVCRMHNYIVSLDDPVTLDLAGDKLATYGLLREAGLTIPAHAAFTLESLEHLRAFVAANDGPLVVKPARFTSSGLGVSTNLFTLGDCLDAAALAFAYCDDAIVERQIPGESYRLLFLGNELVCASRRNGYRVTGDGRQSIAEMLRTARRTAGDSRPLRPDDSDTEAVLRGQSLGRDSVPAAGVSVLLSSRAPGDRDDSELRTVYTHDVTASVAAALVEEARRASLALGSEFCGVDVITPNPSVALAEAGGAINEVNTTPGLHHHYGLEDARPAEALATTVLRYVSERRNDGADRND